MNKEQTNDYMMSIARLNCGGSTPTKTIRYEVNTEHAIGSIECDVEYIPGTCDPNEPRNPLEWTEPVLICVEPRVINDQLVDIYDKLDAEHRIMVMEMCVTHALKELHENA